MPKIPERGSDGAKDRNGEKKRKEAPRKSPRKAPRPITVPGRVSGRIIEPNTGKRQLGGRKIGESTNTGEARPCKACEGTGVSSRGWVCAACQGTKKVRTNA